MEMEREVQNTARRCHSIHEYTPNDIQLLLEWEFLHRQIFAPFQNISVTKKPSWYKVQFEGMIYNCQY